MFRRCSRGFRQLEGGRGGGEDRGLVEDFKQFAEELVVEIDPDIAGRLNVLLPPNLINQLRVTAGKFSFKQ